MPVLDTIALFAAADEDDPRNEVAESHLDGLRKDGFLLASYSLIEMDIVLKSRGYDPEGRRKQQGLLLKDFPNTARKIHPITPTTIYLGAGIEQEQGLDYFDAMIGAEAVEHDGRVVSTDEAFNRIDELERVW
ncbi:hypothetical protein AKJ39_03925 [candidate division MSBL1 archaeon SCGC-AAA259J03]|uniref:PIN domain-containing protein n=1 Tax=candidate division MSBL1 archaeon SCGC-AAA259J03 TaxID=1698269 RepID=A0A656YX61_9EURY|nr:hypothetical protein AKJ39_03925 [candidate division MSBL1 archaeon SCGC-AAA259J03]